MSPLPEKLNNESLKNAGFTLIETLIALVILSIGLIPVMNLSSAFSDTSSIIKNNLIAANLAQEGVEVARTIRDANWFNNRTFNSGLADGAYRVEWDSESLIALGGNPVLKINNGIYNYSAGADTPFQRTITVTNVGPSELKIVADVTWLERGRAKDVQVESRLFNWR